MMHYQEDSFLIVRTISLERKENYKQDVVHFMCLLSLIQLMVAYKKFISTKEAVEDVPIL